MSKGIVFDIQEFCVHDGPGARTVVFFKGCPLRCAWCHNPEGLSPLPELIRSAACVHCGSCAGAQGLLAQGDEKGAVSLCARGFLRAAGRVYDSAALSAELLRQKDALAVLGGGITLSGGECLMQPEFAADLLDGLAGVHRAIQTSGYAPGDTFLHVASRCELVLFDIKHMDDAVHRRFTGVGNAQIQSNLSLLIDSGIPFIARIPMIPGVNDTRANLEATARRLAGVRTLVRVELLPYNVNAGAKYALTGRQFSPGFDTERAPCIANADIFDEYGVNKVVV